MKICRPAHRECGLTLVELLVIMMIIAILAMMVYPRGRMDKARALRVQCINNLKQTGLAFRIWSGNHGDNYPMGLSETNGGTMEFVTGMNAYRHFQIMSNELYTPKVLICPLDKTRVAATNFALLSNSNLCFFVGIDASESNPQMILAGDRNITNGTTIKNGILELTTNSPSGWASELHNKVGSLLLSDGSLQQFTSKGLQNAVASTGLATNRLQMPALTP